MSSSDHIKIANQVRDAVKNGKSFSFPLMRATDFFKVLKHLRQQEQEALALNKALGKEEVHERLQNKEGENPSTKDL